METTCGLRAMWIVDSRWRVVELERTSVSVERCRLAGRSVGGGNLTGSVFFSFSSRQSRRRLRQLTSWSRNSSATARLCCGILSQRPYCVDIRLKFNVSSFLVASSSRGHRACRRCSTRMLRGNCTRGISALLHLLQVFSLYY